jgi:hypothetical protein
MTENDPYPGTGELGQAIKDLTLLVMNDDNLKTFPRYWREFASQLFADIIVLKTEISLLKDPPKKKRKLRSGKQ